MDGGAWWDAVHGVTKSQTRLSDFRFTFHVHALEKEMATHSSVLAWRIPGTGEPGGLPSMGLHRVGHDWSTLAAAEIRALPGPGLTQPWFPSPRRLALGGLVAGPGISELAALGYLCICLPGECFWSPSSICSHMGSARTYTWMYLLHPCGESLAQGCLQVWTAVFTGPAGWGLSFSYFTDKETGASLWLIGCSRVAGQVGVRAGLSLALLIPGLASGSSQL